jgi:hypothetical protein
MVALDSNSLHLIFNYLTSSSNNLLSALNLIVSVSVSLNFMPIRDFNLYVSC